MAGADPEGRDHGCCDRGLCGVSDRLDARDGHSQREPVRLLRGGARLGDVVLGRLDLRARWGVRRQCSPLTRARSVGSSVAASRPCSSKAPYRRLQRLVVCVGSKTRSDQPTTRAVRRDASADRRRLGRGEAEQVALRGGVLLVVIWPAPAGMRSMSPWSSPSCVPSWRTSRPRSSVTTPPAVETPCLVLSSSSRRSCGRAGSRLPTAAAPVMSTAASRPPGWRAGAGRRPPDRRGPAGSRAAARAADRDSGRGGGVDRSGLRR